MATASSNPSESLLAPTDHASEEEIVGDHLSGKQLGKYQIIRRLGRGGMGVVYEAIDPILQRSVAIKVLREGIAAMPEAVRKFLREARTAARLNHQNVVAVYEADQQKGIVYLVMELMEGGSAHDRIRKWGPFGWVEATQVMIDACRGLAAVHQTGLVHRDIKPSNVMRAADGTVKLADFGLATAIETSSEQSTPDGQVVGTPLYMSPEQCKGLRIDARSDIYSIGATYFTLLTGTMPFDGKSAMDIMYGHCSRPIPDPCLLNAIIPAGCGDLIRRMLAKIPEDRPPDALNIVRELEVVLAQATSPDIKPLDWATPGNDLTATPIPGAENTIAGTVHPLYVTTRRPRTRTWFVVTCLILMGIAYGIGRYNTRRGLPEPVPTPLPVVDHPPKEEGDTTGAIDAGGPVSALAFDGLDRTRLFWGTMNGGQTVVDWPMPGNRDALSPTRAIADPIRQVAWWPVADGPVWASLHQNKVQIRRVADLRIVWAERPCCSVGDKLLVSIGLHPGGELIALAVQDGPASKQGGFFLSRVAEVKVNNTRKCWQFDNKAVPTCIAFSADGKWLASGQGNGIVTRWQVEAGKVADDERLSRAAGISLGADPITALVAVDESLFAAALGNRIWICDAKQGTRVGDGPMHAGQLPVKALASCPATARVACAAGGSIFIYDGKAGKLVGEFNDVGDNVSVMAFDRDGRWLAIGQADGRIVVRAVK